MLLLLAGERAAAAVLRSFRVRMDPRALDAVELGVKLLFAPPLRALSSSRRRCHAGFSSASGGARGDDEVDDVGVDEEASLVAILIITIDDDDDDMANVKWW